MSRSNVLVSGASGYVASHIIKLLLEKGYHVIGTVRSIANKDRYAFLYQFPNAKEHLELRQADLLNPQSWDTALKGVQSVMHVASPLPAIPPADQNEIIKPAVEGTKNIIESCLRNKVKRLVFTSSTLSIVVRTDGKVTNQDDWSDPSLLSFYPKSKYLAEKLFWEEAQKHKNQMEFVSVLPSLVTGPSYTKHGGTSQGVVSEVLNGGYPGIPSPPATHSAIDVRDLAVGHVKALQYPQAASKRYIISGYTMQSDYVFEILRKKYAQLGYNIPSNPVDAETCIKSGNPAAILDSNFLGLKFPVDNSRSINELGMNYRSAQQSILDQAQSQIRLDIVKQVEKKE